MTPVDERSLDRRGWARFSSDRRLRYRLARSLTDAPLRIRGDRVAGARRIVFLMLNPSTADAFVLDPTIRRCVAFATREGGDVLEVVNLFAFRSPLPRLLKAARRRGADPANDRAILAACRGAHRIVAAWGIHGQLAARDEAVRALLAECTLHRLGATADGHPIHPLARGVHWVPSDRELERWR